MRTYILRRLLGIVPTVLMITLVVFVMMRSVPGDPVVALLGDAYTEEDAERTRKAYGLDQPIMVQYVIWLGKLAQGDWGTSVLSGRPVLKDVLLRLPVTLPKDAPTVRLRFSGSERRTVVLRPGEQRTLAFDVPAHAVWRVDFESNSGAYLPDFRHVSVRSGTPTFSGR